MSNADIIIAPPMPKHIPFPDFSNNSEIINELIMFLFSTFAAAMQFINIYRTIWWLKDSNMHHKVNLHLIDLYLVTLIIVLNARRLIYCCLLRLLDLLQSQHSKRLYRNMLKYGFSIILSTVLLYCVANVYAKNNYLSLYVLLYPIVVYLLTFGFNIEPLLRSSCEVEGTYFNGMPMHSCSTNPSIIRDEIDVLRSDFNIRFRQVFFTSVLNAYYAGFVPCFFATSVYFNMVWVIQHIIFVWFSALTLQTAFIFPSKYCDILHRASLHLGCWTKLEVRPNSSGLICATSTAWNKTTAWPNGSIVKHSGEVFRCNGPVTVALPTNTTHTRFYALFHNPSIIYMILTSVQAFIIITEFISLCFVIEWHFILSISFLTLTNQYTLFKIIRDYMITRRLYVFESTISDKQNTLHNN